MAETWMNRPGSAYAHLVWKTSETGLVSMYCGEVVAGDLDLCDEAPKHCASCQLALGAEKREKANGCN